ncbi:hypothetical protein [Paenibacillus lutrae]|uniref:Uncharacterized protein n=1 Tax=Paenibacillus lutrae TaxID=2078573 RepID=A0A7X3FJA7_9BACL|nr:hypothetical protein [Paenibacillus lutrae]MVP00778.1 hypothetical protein [Paenibacillus lutrae]
MAICIEFKLIKVSGTLATYQYGECLREMDGLFEVDVYKLITGEIPGDTPMSEVVRLLPSATKSEFMAYRAFRKIRNYYVEHGEYPVQGGYYA